jgi:phosphoglycerate dehydrogenase-like enzyme
MQRELERYAAQQQERVWLRRPLPMARHRVLVLGTGAMGGEIVDWLGRVGLQARGWNRRSPERLTTLLGRATSSSAPCR